jgi:integrase
MARDMVKPLVHQVGLGHDPAAEKQERRNDKETLGEAIAAYLKVKAGELKPRTYVETERYLDRTAHSLHSRPLTAIPQREIADLLNKVADKKATVNRLRANLSTLFTWAARQGKVTQNPVAFTEKRAEKARDRVLKEPELARSGKRCPIATTAASSSF